MLRINVDVNHANQPSLYLCPIKLSLTDIDFKTRKTTSMSVCKWRKKRETQTMLDIHYLDEYLVVVHKPSGLLVHRSNIDRYETQFLLQTLRDQISQQVFPVHRLDKPTSGLMVFALNKDVAKALGEAFANRLVDKQYLAIVRGYTESQVIDYPLKEQLDKMTDNMANQDKQAQDALTHVELLSTAQIHFPIGRYPQARYSLVRLYPKSGRKHQLRRHMAHIRHPIIGDTSHGDGKQNQYARQHLGLNRLGLIAHHLSFVHPISGKKLRFEAKIDDDLQQAFGIFQS